LNGAQLHHTSKKDGEALQEGIYKVRTKSFFPYKTNKRGVEPKGYCYRGRNPPFRKSLVQRKESSTKGVHVVTESRGGDAVRKK